MPPVSPACSRSGCLNHPLQRHHMGCEKMWITHFRHRKRTKKWRAFRERYFMFLPEDVALLCAGHHRQIHGVYYSIIGSWALRLGPCKTWTWAQAEELMAHLRSVFVDWTAGKAITQTQVVSQ